MNASLKWTLAVAALASLAIAGTFQLGDDGPSADASPVQYREVEATIGPFRLAVNANGLVRPIDRIELKSKASGEVTKLPIEVGDRVAEGALIAQLDQVEERAALAQAQADLEIARAELDLAEKNFARRERLFSNDIISEELQDKTELDRAVARSRLVQARTSLDRAHERMEETVITSPVTGIILQKYVERGQIIASGVSNVGGGTPIADVADMGNVHVEAGIDEIDIGKISVGQHATVRAEAYPEHVYRGAVARVAPEARVEQNVTLFDVIIDVSNSDGNLRSGMNATVEIVVDDRPAVLTIPAAALQTGDSDTAPHVLVKREGTFAAREILTGATDHRVVEVLDGVSDGDVLGIPMVSQLKRDHDLLDARIRQSRGFGGGAPDSKKRKSPRS